MKKFFIVSLLALIGFISNAQTVGGFSDYPDGNTGYNDEPVVWYNSTDGKIHFSITYYFPSANFTYEEADAGIWYSSSYPYDNLNHTGESEYFDPCENPVPTGSKTYEGTIDVSGISSTTHIWLEYGMSLAADNNISAGYNPHGEFAFYFTP